jgi:hypothetical protein
MSRIEHSWSPGVSPITRRDERPPGWRPPLLSPDPSGRLYLNPNCLACNTSGFRNQQTARGHTSLSRLNRTAARLQFHGFMPPAPDMGPTFLR